MRLHVVIFSLFVVAASQTYTAVPASAQVAGGLAHGVPSFNITTICSRVSGITETSGGCVEDERTARDQLGKVWTKYSSADRSRCADLSSEAGLASYVELLTCLQMTDDAKGLSNE